MWQPLPSRKPDGEMTFPARLRHAREKAGLSQEDLAARAGLTANTIGALERGERRHPYPATIRVLAKALGLTEDERAALASSVPRRGDGNGSANVGTAHTAGSARSPDRPRPRSGGGRGAPRSRGRPAGDADRPGRGRQDAVGRADRVRPRRLVPRSPDGRAARIDPRPGPRGVGDRPRRRRWRDRGHRAHRARRSCPRRPTHPARARQLRTPARRGAAGDGPARPLPSPDRPRHQSGQAAPRRRARRPSVAAPGARSGAPAHARRDRRVPRGATLRRAGVRHRPRVRPHRRRTPPTSWPSATGWTGCRSRSSWPPLEPSSSHPRPCSPALRAGCRCSRPAGATRRTATRPCATPSPGATPCSRPASRHYFGRLASSSGASPWRPPRR